MVALIQRPAQMSANRLATAPAAPTTALWRGATFTVAVAHIGQFPDRLRLTSLPQRPLGALDKGRTAVDLAAAP